MRTASLKRHSSGNAATAAYGLSTFPRCALRNPTLRSFGLIDHLEGNSAIEDSPRISVCRARAGDAVHRTGQRPPAARKMRIARTRTRKPGFYSGLSRLIQSRTDMDSLAARASHGDISPEEATELDSYLHVGNLLTIMRSRARVYLKVHEASPSSQ